MRGPSLLLSFMLSILLFASGDEGVPPCRQLGGPQASWAVPRDPHLHGRRSLLWLTLPLGGGRHGGSPPLGLGGAYRCWGPSGNPGWTAPMGKASVSARLSSCTAAAATAAAPATPRRGCTWQGAPEGTPAAVGGAHRWLALARDLREAPSLEARLKRLMELALEGPLASGPWGFTEASERHAISGGTDTGIAQAVTEGTRASAATAATATVKTPFGSFLIGPWRILEGCAAAASVRVALRLPEALLSSSSSSNRSSTRSEEALCCAAAAQGVQIHIQQTSDSLVVGGLLQLLSRGLSGGPPCSVGSLKVPQLLQRSGLLLILPETRTRGLHGALAAVRNATQQLLQKHFASGMFMGEPNAHEGPLEILTAGCSTPAATIATHANLGGPPSKGKLVQASPRGNMLGASLGPPGSLVVRDTETAEWAERSRISLPAVGGAGTEVSVLVSGGVDSSVSLLLLREWGFRPKPVFLKVWAPEAAQLRQAQQEQQQGALTAAAAAAAAACPWQQDAEAAAAAAAAAGLTLEVLPMQQQYWDRVIFTFLKGAREGLTLNPDWSCNSSVKFGAFAEALGCADAKIASGHYARVQIDGSPNGGGPRLLRGVDGVKDQSYFLSGLSPDQLSRLLLPVGSLLKTQVRQLALRWGLPSAQRPDSQGLCFLGPVALKPFLYHVLGKREGPILHFLSGAPVGKHGGLWGLTAGQQRGVVPLLDPCLCRRCLFSPGGPPTLSGPWSVVGKLPEANALFVVSREEEAAAEARVRELVAAGAPEGASGGGRLLEAAARGDPGALLAIKLRQLRTYLRVENIRWIGGVPPPEFVAAEGAPKGNKDPSAVEAAVAAAADAAVQQGGAILSGRPSGGIPMAPPGTYGKLIVQVRHSAAFDGIAKHRFKTLWVVGDPTGESPRDTLGARAGASLGGPVEAPPGAPGVTQAAGLLLDEPDVGLAPGQVAAFYRGDECLGSGVISALQGLSLLQEALEKKLVRH